MEAIKTSESVEFDVIYADGTRHHVSEGVLFEVKSEKMVFHNGTDRPAVLIAAAEAAAEVLGHMAPTEQERALIIYNIHKRLFGQNKETTDMPTTDIKRSVTI